MFPNQIDLIFLSKRNFVDNYINYINYTDSKLDSTR